MDRPRSGGNALDEMPQAGGPRPQRLAFLVDFPYLAFLGPSLETLRRPIIAEQLQDAVRAVELDRGAAILLHREAGGDAGKPAVTEIEQHLRIVVRLDGHLDAFGHSFRDRRADHRAHAPHGSHEAAETHQVVDAEIEKRSATRPVIPLPPPGAGPSIACASEHDLADFSRMNVGMHGPVRRRQHDVRSADQKALCAPADPQQLARRGDAGRHRLFDQDVFARLESGLRQFRMFVHARQHKNRIDIVTRDELCCSGGRRDRWMHGGDRRRLVAVDVECGGQSRLPALLELADQLAIRPQKDATESKYAESKHSVSALDLSGCDHSGRCHG